MSCARVPAALGAGARLAPPIAPKGAAHKPLRQLAARAAFPGGLGGSPDAFHGVFHSTRLPDVLAGEHPAPLVPGPRSGHAARTEPTHRPAPLGSRPVAVQLTADPLPPEPADRVGLADARDAVEACSGVAEGAAKEACFAVFGVSPDAGAWIDSVSALEASLELETLPEEEGLHHGLERC
jgi:hypothetical protein